MDKKTGDASLSFAAWAVLSQLKKCGVWDGDVLDKSGRTELIKRGLARRDRKFTSGPHAGCQINELTEDGAVLALSFDDEYWRAMDHKH